MNLLSLHDYLPVSDLVKIVIVTLAVAVAAPAAVSLGIVGLDRRESGNTAVGDALVVVCIGLLAVLVGVGIYALVDK
jgi:hypothetical protein